MFFSNFVLCFRVFWGFEMANEDPRTFSNTFWMISGTSKILSKSGPVALLIITRMLQKIQEELWDHPGKIIYVNLGLTTFRTFLKFGPTKHLFFFILLPHPQKRLVSPSVFKKMFGGGVLVF